MRKVIIIGAGIGGCAAAIAFAQKGWAVQVIEKLQSIFTSGAGILLYSNALKSLEQLSVLDEVIGQGFVMHGDTIFLDSMSNQIGTVRYTSIDTKYPAYVGINRQTFLEILYNRALSLGAIFKFNCEFVEDQFSNCDLLIAANGTNSNIRTRYWSNSESVYSGFGVWHSMHDLHPKVKEKITVVLDDRKFGIIPINNKQMYIWASLSEPIKRWIDPKDHAAEMHKSFAKVGGFLKDILDQLTTGAYAHYTSVEEVSIDDTWHKNNIVLLGDAAHASLPFMAQGGAMALQDAVVLANLCELHDIENALVVYKEKRKPVVDQVQQMCRNIGKSYANSTVDFVKVQENLDKFYSSKTYFN